MMLVEDGKLELTDPVSKFLPAMKNMQVSVAKVDAEFARTTYTLVPADREITVQDLLRHSAGLAYANLTQNKAVIDAYVKGGIEADLRGLKPDEEVELMTSDHLGSRIQALSPMTPGEVLLSTQGYTFGLGFAVRLAPGVAGVPGSAGEFMWGGYAGTYFWVDPKEQLVAVYMTQAPSPIRSYYRKLFKQMVYAAILD